MQRKKADLSKTMAAKVFDISMDAQEGALYSVLDDMSDQYIKEQLLAYFLLLKNKYAATEVCVLLADCYCCRFGLSLSTLYFIAISLTTASVAEYVQVAFYEETAVLNFWDFLDKPVNEC
jgi:hypothetical protein